MEVTYNKEEEWDDITHCVIKPKITAELNIAGGGSHAWSYFLEWDDENDDEPEVYIFRYPFREKEKQNSKIRIRTEISSGCQSVRMFNNFEDIPEDNDEYSYSNFMCPLINNK